MDKIEKEKKEKRKKRRRLTWQHISSRDNELKKKKKPNP